MAIAYEELDLSPQEQVAPHNYTATCQFKCAWADRYDVMNYFAYGSGQMYPRWNIPARVRGIGCVPFGAATGTLLDVVGQKLMQYEHALVTVQFVLDSQTPKGSGNEDLISESIEPTAEFQTISPFGLVWESDFSGLTPEEAPGILRRGLNFCLTRYNVPYVPTAILSLAGCCNAAPVACRYLGLTFPAETLLFSPPQMQQKISTEGASPWTLNFRFSFKPHGWNKFWRSETGQWEAIYRHVVSGGGDVEIKPFPPGDFSQIM